MAVRGDRHRRGGLVRQLRRWSPAISATEVELRDNDPSHYFGVTSGVTIKKYTNGVDADTPTGPVLRVGDLVHWTYVVTNTGNLPIAGWTVVDDIIGTVGCPRIVLLPERPVTCFATGTVEEGQYANVGTVNATDVLGDPLTAEDPSHYLGIAPAIELVKFTNDEDANLPTGPLIAAGRRRHLDLRGDQHRDRRPQRPDGCRPPARWKTHVVDCDATELDPGESTLCTATGTAELGQYVNSRHRRRLRPVLAAGELGRPFSLLRRPVGDLAVQVHQRGRRQRASRPQHPRGRRGGVDVRRGQHRQHRGERHRPRGRHLGPITCPLDTLGVGEEMRCTATGTAERGQYANTATVTGVDEVGHHGLRRRSVALLRLHHRRSTSRSRPTVRTPTTPPARRSRWATR